MSKQKRVRVICVHETSTHVLARHPILKTPTSILYHGRKQKADYFHLWRKSVLICATIAICRGQKMKVKFVFLGGQNAGKTSILRRHFHGNFYADGRMPTIGADVYSTITTTRSSPSPSTTDTSEVEEDKKEERNYFVETAKNNHTARRRPISIQVWDTPGRERFVNPNGKTRYTAYFSDNFLRDVDAVCLVYDVSSSTSFTHVLNWYYELIERIRRMKANHERTRHLPIVIVGNKIDIFQDRDTRQKELLNRKKEIVQQRNVLGLTGNWRGRDYRYEYSANAPALTSAPTKPKENRLELLTYLGTNTNYLEAILNNEVYRGSYLDSLLSSEDNSHPDKDMVQLWCMVSAFQYGMIT